ncbi:MAG: hypothetical protein V8T65_18100 [Roseburia inulinivorans]
MLNKKWLSASSVKKPPDKNVGIAMKGKSGSFLPGGFCGLGMQRFAKK